MTDMTERERQIHDLMPSDAVRLGSHTWNVRGTRIVASIYDGKLTIRPDTSYYDRDGRIQRLFVSYGGEQVPESNLSIGRRLVSYILQRAEEWKSWTQRVDVDAQKHDEYLARRDDNREKLRLIGYEVAKHNNLMMIARGLPSLVVTGSGARFEPGPSINDLDQFINNIGLIRDLFGS